MNQRTLFLAAVASVILVTSTFGVYVATWSPGPLVVTDGFTTGVIAGNFTNMTSTTNALIQYFNATTYANQTGQVSSTITLDVYTFTYCVYCGVVNSDGGYLLIDTTVTAIGHFASDLHPTNVTLAENETAATSSGGDIFVQSWVQNGTNVSYSPEQGFGFWGTGSGTVTATLTNQTGKGSTYTFRYQDEFVVKERYWYRHFVGFEATVGGLGTPVGVKVVLEIVET